MNHLHRQCNIKPLIRTARDKVFLVASNAIDGYIGNTFSKVAISQNRDECLPKGLT